ncbi:MAG: NfeD family protein [Pseudanabaenales cyanobacterium]|nr:NfeD family protein [Pseudanabaenales cyanobacterium]
MSPFTQFWVVLGTVLCLMELFLPTAFVESTLGVSAFVVALLSLIVPQFSLQVLLWMILSLIFIFLLRRFAPKQTPYTLVESTEARTITAIEPGQTGRVIYEGNSWQARCEDDRLAIAVDQPVVVLRRKGNTLFVLPESELTA